jgi:hypothetical protein
MAHDYKRNGTTTLFAALNVLDDQVIGQCQQRHTRSECLKFLRKIDREYVAHHNKEPKPFIWTKSARDILQKVIRANSRLRSKQNATLH